MRARQIFVLVVLAAGLAGCVQTQPHLGGDFGYAIRAAAVAQIANPNAVYTGDPAPGSDGSRVALAQERYRTGKVIEPVAVASSISSATSIGMEAK